MSKEIIYREKDVEKLSTAKVLIEALPYIQHLSNKVIVIKFGGNAMTDDTLRNNFARDVVLLKQVGLHPVIVHGGGPQITSHLKKLGIESKFAHGLRITDPESIHTIEMVLGGLVNKDIDFKNTGTVQSIDPEVVSLLDGSPFIPVIAPIGIGDDGTTYNINADLVAGKMAHILQAGKYLILTNTSGILDDKDKLIKSINAHEVRKLIKKGVISRGMLPKIESALEAVSSGVEHVQIINGTIDHSVLLELFTDSGIGTMIRRL